ncbi:UNKNOWN [Stylonychia lemnae]|uniref:Uncharacterized protein n=1 Tax=Stylonychia lemnae TaxID=5949 RepID=A0A078A6I2_STYLE|nr:UNKNOWN [Stylonychia lemnae]|eukprot:CDW77486.1 UNKNOWN [Stylonychia lemnae]
MTSDLSRLNNLKQEFEQEQKSAATQPCKNLLMVTSAVIAQTVSLKNQLKEVTLKVESFVNDADRICKGIISTLEAKYQEYAKITKFYPEQKQGILLDIKDYTDKSVYNVELLRKTVCEYEESLMKINKWRQPKLELSKGVYCFNEIIAAAQDIRLANFSNALENINSDLFALQQLGSKNTEILKLIVDKENYLQFEKVKTFPKQLNLVMTHKNRIICDDFVYTFRDDSKFELIQDFQQTDIASGLVLTDDLLLLGHSLFAKMSLWKWNGEQYIKLVKHQIVNISKTVAEFSITMLRRDPFTDLICQVYGVFGCNQMCRVLINGRNMRASEKFNICKKNHLIVDYRPLPEKQIAVLFTHQFVVMDLKTRAKLANVKFQTSQNTLIMPLNFDLALLPVIITRDLKGKYQVSDVMNKGFVGIMPERLQTLQIIAPINGIKDDRVVVLANDVRNAGQLNKKPIIQLHAMARGRPKKIDMMKIESEIQTPTIAPTNDQQCNFFIQKLNESVNEVNKLKELKLIINQKLDKFCDNAQIQTQYMVCRLEDKMRSTMRSEGGSSQQTQDVYQLVGEQNGCLDQIQQYIKYYKTLLDNINQVSIPKDLFRREVSAQIVERAKVDNLLKYESEAFVLSDNLFALKQFNVDFLDIFGVTKNDDDGGVYQISLLQTLPQKVFVVFMHDDRIICDDIVYAVSGNDEFGQIQNLGQYDISHGCALYENFMILGHKHYTRLSIWNYNGVGYQMVQKKKMHRSGPYADFSVTNIKKDLLSGDPTMIFCCMGRNNLYRIQIDMNDIYLCKKQKIVNRRQQLVDYKAIDSTHMIVLFASEVLLVDYVSSDTKRVLSLKSDQLCLVVPYNFNIQNMPIIIVKNPSGYEIVDIQTQTSQTILSSKNLTVLNTFNIDGDKQDETIVVGFNNPLQTDFGLFQVKVM